MQSVLLSSSHLTSFCMQARLWNSELFDPSHEVWHASFISFVTTPSKAERGQQLCRVRARGWFKFQGIHPLSFSLPHTLFLTLPPPLPPPLPVLCRGEAALLWAIRDLPLPLLARCSPGAWLDVNSESVSTLIFYEIILEDYYYYYYYYY